MGNESSIHQQFSMQRLQAWLQQGDPAAEGVVTLFRARRLPLADPTPMIRELAVAGEPACQQLLQEMEVLPDWVDFSLMAKGGAMGYRQFPQLALALTHGGLPMSFATPEAARILGGSNRLEQNVVRRLFESATLFFGVLDTEALRPAGAVWDICLRVRLMHSMVRLRLMAAGDWTPEEGKPINPVHVAAGPLFFGSMVLRSLSRLGARVSEEEAEGYKLIWRYVTYLLGVPQEMLGSTDAEQERINNEILLPLVFGPDDNSRRLINALMSGLTHMPMLGQLPRGMHEALSRHLLGQELADEFALPDSPLMKTAVGMLVLSLRGYGLPLRLPALRRQAVRIGQDFMTGFLQHGLRGVAADFQEHPR
ncbi:MAG: oxygenase MpaB family protein [Pedobacter sp.]|nr:oxygenase MpaB family protein [Pedobacter sp.]